MHGGCAAGGVETGKEFELGDGKVRFIPLGMFQEREKNFKKKSFDEQVRRSLPYIGAAVIGEAADTWGQLSRWVVGLVLGRSGILV